jgi:hypothetical protein
MEEKRPELYPVHNEPNKLQKFVPFSLLKPILSLHVQMDEHKADTPKCILALFILLITSNQLANILVILVCGIYVICEIDHIRRIHRSRQVRQFATSRSADVSSSLQYNTVCYLYYLGPLWCIWHICILITRTKWFMLMFFFTDVYIVTVVQQATLQRGKVVRLATK